MPEMGITVTAAHLQTRHAKRMIIDISDALVICGSVQRRPTAAAVEFRQRREQLCATRAAGVGPAPVATPILAGIWPFRTGLAQHLICFRTEAFAPLLL